MKQPKRTQEDIARERAAAKGFELKREDTGLVGVYGPDGARYAGLRSWGYVCQWLRHRRPLGTESLSTG